MGLYVIIILSAMAATVIGNYWFFMDALGFTWAYNIGAVIVGTVAVIALDGVIAYFCHKLQPLLNPDSAYFRVSGSERRLLERLGVKKFKSLIPDLGGLAKFPKGKIAKPGSKEYINMYILETCTGEIDHIVSMFAGFLIVLLFPIEYAWCFGIPIGTVNFVLNLLPVLALRYNRFKLTLLYKQLVRREIRRSAAENTEADICAENT